MRHAAREGWHLQCTEDAVPSGNLQRWHAVPGPGMGLRRVRLKLRVLQCWQADVLRRKAQVL